MTLRHMRILVSVFQKNSITKAAQELHLAQPSVSLAVRELEEYYGIRLFDRIGRHIAPTECGKEFYEYAVHIVSLFNEMEQKMRNWDTFGTLRVGASITIGTHILPVLIHGYQEKFPDLTIEAKVSRSASIEDELIHSGIDLGLIETQPSHPDLRAVPFMTDSMCVIIPPGHPLSSAKSISLAGLSRFPFLMREKGSAGRELLDAAFSLQQITVSPRWESTSTQALVKAVAEGLGVSVLPYLLVKNANVKHFFTLLGKMFFTLYGKEFFTYPGKKIFTSLRLPVGTGQGASAGRIPRGKSNTWHGAGSGPTSQW